VSGEAGQSHHSLHCNLAGNAIARNARDSELELRYCTRYTCPAIESELFNKAEETCGRVCKLNFTLRLAFFRECGAARVWVS
jgi:hypothetical protein